MHFASSRFHFAFSRLPSSKPLSFAADSLSFLEGEQPAKNDEDILVTNPDTSIHGATISVDVSLS